MLAKVLSGVVLALILLLFAASLALKNQISDNAAYKANEATYEQALDDGEKTIADLRKAGQASDTLHVKTTEAARVVEEADKTTNTEIDDHVQNDTTVAEWASGRVPGSLVSSLYACPDGSGKEC